MTSLRGKVAIITGASSGIGAASARRFAREGCTTVLAARRMGHLEQLAAEIRASGSEALTLEVDVSQPQQIDAMVRSAVDTYGRIDILFNNAGFGRLDWLENLDPVNDIQTQITVDLLGVILAARAVLPQMYGQRAGHIINMSSLAGWLAPPLYTVYSAGKFGVRGFSEALRREAAPMGVKVSVIYPGRARTEFGLHVGEGARRRLRIPSWLALTADDVAASVISLAKHPRRELVTPWLMVFIKFLNSHFGSISDLLQSRATREHHKR